MTDELPDPEEWANARFADLERKTLRDALRFYLWMIPVALAVAWFAVWITTRFSVGVDVFWIALEVVVIGLTVIVTGAVEAVRWDKRDEELRSRSDEGPTG